MDPISPVPPDPPDPVDVDMASQQVASKRRHADNSQEGPIKKSIIDKELASASIQTTYTHPEMSIIGIRSYDDSDAGPYIIHVSRVNIDPASDMSIRPIKFGQFLHSNKIENICQDGVKKVGRNKISITFKSASGANKFIDHPMLKLYNYEATIPTYNITRMGLVRGVPVDWSMDEFVNSIQTPGCATRIMKARRLNRKIKDDGNVKWEPTQTVVLTFRGQQLPYRIFSYYSSLLVEAYQFPTIQCMHCCRFGHIKAQCRSKPRCYRCAQPHAGDDCSIPENESSCIFCSKNHFSTSRTCPEQERQKSIKIVMSRDGVSYEEAANQFPKTGRTFNEIVKEVPSAMPPRPRSPISSTHIPSQTVPPQSYKKIVQSSPRPRAAPQGVSYDKSAHQAIVSDVPSALPNGYCLQMSQQSTPPSQPQDQLLVQLLTIIINIISQNSINLPPNVAHMITQLSSLATHNYGSVSNNSAVELQKSSSKDS